MPYFVQYLIVMFMVHQKEKIHYMNNRNAIKMMKEEGELGTYNIQCLCVQLDKWAKM
jgi:hypothetical protein